MFLQRVLVSTLATITTISTLRNAFSASQTTVKVFKKDKIVSVIGFVLAVPTYLFVSKKVDALKEKIMKGGK